MNTATISTLGTFETMPIAGVWRPGGGTGELVDTDPWSGAELTRIGLAGPADVEAAYAAAVVAQREWAGWLPEQRAAVMRTAADILTMRHEEIRGWIVAESGGTIAKAEIELAVARAVFLEAAGMPHHVEGSILPSDIPGKENRVYRVPVGVVCLISPWDFPVYLTARTLAPALALGNAVVLKPSSQTPVTGGLLLARVLEEAGLPAGLLSVLVGSGREVGDALVSHPTPRVVSFTGSTETGIGISQKAGIKKLLLELGGNAPLVVLDDADLDYAVESAVFGSFYNSGQICMIANRVIVDSSMHDDFVEAFVARTRVPDGGRPRRPRHVRRARDQRPPAGLGAGQGAPSGQPRRSPRARRRPVRTRGPDAPASGPASGPTSVATAQEEVFGPAITIVSADGEEDALRLANDTEYGLSSAVHTADHERGVRFALRVEAGMTHVNDSPVNEEDNTAYGGEKQSGLGRFGGRWSVDEFTTQHWVSVQHERRPYPLS